MIYKHLYRKNCYFWNCTRFFIYLILNYYKFIKKKKPNKNVVLQTFIDVLELTVKSLCTVFDFRYGYSKMFFFFLIVRFTNLFLIFICSILLYTLITEIISNKLLEQYNSRQYFTMQLTSFNVYVSKLYNILILYFILWFACTHYLFV
jgi:hypothetical protein